MIQAILTAYVIVKWIGEFNLLSEKGGEMFLSVLCFLANIGIVLPMFTPGGLRRLAALFNSENRRYGVLYGPILWILFFILYPSGMVDWFVSVGVLENNQGYWFSHETPGGFDIFALILVLLMFVIIPILKFFDLTFGD